MREVDDLIRALENPDPPIRAPAWPAPDRRVGPRWAWAAVGAGLMAAGLAMVLLLRPPSPGLRGISTDAVELDLRMVVERGGVAVRISAPAILHQGERVLFRVAADRPGRALLWVEEPGGRTSIATSEVGTVARNVGDGEGLVGYRFDRPGRYVFHLEPVEGSCARCPAVTVQVLPGELR